MATDSLMDYFSLWPLLMRATSHFGYFSLRLLLIRAISHLGSFSLGLLPKFLICSIPSFQAKKNDCLYRASFFLNHLIFQVLAQVSVTEALSDDFRVADDAESDNILVFASSIFKKYLRRAWRKRTRNRRYFTDGTFKSILKPFYQLFTLHVDLSSDSKSTQIVPVVYALLPNKNQDNVYKAFQYNEKCVENKHSQF